MQHEKCMRRVILSSVVSVTLPCFFSTLSHKQHDFWKNVIEHTMCVFILSESLSETFLILRRIMRDISINVYWYSCTVAVMFVHLTKLEILRQFFEKESRIKFHENSSTGSRIVSCGKTDKRTDGWTDGRTDGRRDEQLA